MKIKAILGWSLFVLIVGSMMYYAVHSIYLQELEHGHTEGNAIAMTAASLITSLTGCWLGAKIYSRLAKAAKYAALHPYIPKVRNPSR